jgi:hypothetical protein
VTASAHGRQWQRLATAMNDDAYPVDRMRDVPPMLGATIFTNATPATVSNTSGSAISALLRRAGPSNLGHISM